VAIKWEPHHIPTAVNARLAASLSTRRAHVLTGTSATLDASWMLSFSSFVNHTETHFVCASLAFFSGLPCFMFFFIRRVSREIRQNARRFNLRLDDRQRELERRTPLVKL
jgi:hypothetical protein